VPFKIINAQATGVSENMEVHILGANYSIKVYHYTVAGYSE
jgi:hypothetical protein